MMPGSSGSDMASGSNSMRCWQPAGKVQRKRRIGVEERAAASHCKVCAVSCGL